MTPDDASFPESSNPPPAPARRSPAWIGYALAPVLTAVATATALGVESVAPVASLSLIFVLPVVILAVAFGWRSAMTAAVLSVLSFNFFLIEPRYTLRVADPGNVWALVLLLAVGAIVSTLAAQSRRRAEVALALAGQATAVQGLARELVAAPDRETILSEAAAALHAMLGAPVAVLVEAGEGFSVQTSPARSLSKGDLEAARWAIGARARARAEAFPAEAVSHDFWPAGGSRVPAAVGVDLSRGADALPPDWERSVEIVAGYVAVALERAHLADEVLGARLRVESERVKADLLAAVSHDLKTPLSSILLSLQTMRRFGGRQTVAARDELLAVAEAETARLGGLVANLLDMSRIDADAVAVKPAPLAVEALIDAARLRAPALQGRQVTVEAAERVTVLADASLAETALANVLDNAARYSSEGAPVEITVVIDDARAQIIVRDRGTGFPDPAERLFGKFARGVEGDGRPPGTGLGLAIARGFLQAQGGAIEAGNREDGVGGEVRIWLPLAAAKRAAA